MTKKDLRLTIISIITWTYFLCFANNPLHAQLWGNEMDSLEQARLERRKNLQANPTVQKRVDAKINEERLLMLAYEWWSIPSIKEQSKIDKAIESRYEPYNTSLESSDWRNKAGVLHRTNEKVLAKQNLTIFGWHPYWKGDTYKTYNYKLLTHLAFYGYEVNPFTGGYNNFQAINDFIDSDLVMTAHLDSCKVLLTVSNRGYDNHDVFFSSEPDVQENLIDSIRSIIKLSGADGVDLNFEDVPVHQKHNFINFVKELSFAVREDNSNHIVSMAVPVYDKDNVYDLDKLKPWIDFFVITSFNFHIKNTELKEGPLSPLTAKDASIRGTTFMYEIRTTLDQLLASPYLINDVYLEHDEEYEKKLRDSLNYHIR